MFYLNLSFHRELTLFWSKLQRRIDPSLDTFLERCRQFGVIAKTQQHLFCLIRVIQTEVSNFTFFMMIVLKRRNEWGDNFGGNSS